MHCIVFMTAAPRTDETYQTVYNLLVVSCDQKYCVFLDLLIIIKNSKSNGNSLTDSNYILLIISCNVFYSESPLGLS